MTGCHFFLESSESQDVEGNSRINGEGGDGEVMEYEVYISQSQYTKASSGLPPEVAFIH